MCIRATIPPPMYRGIELQYRCDLQRLPAALRERFVELEADASTRAWIDDALLHPQSRATSALRDLSRKIVGIYDANALTGAYPMRVLSTEQWRLLVGEGAGRLLDVGAGDGHVTAQAAPLYDEVVTTELSAPMARRLRRRGWRCHERDIATGPLAGEAPFETVSILNVLDRMPFPFATIERLPALVAEGGTVVLAVPMPLSPVVFAGPSTHDPEELLPQGTRDWETGVVALWKEVLDSRGLTLRALSRVPYLCRGDARKPVAVLDDAIFVCGLRR